MASDLSIKKDLKPNDKVLFVITLDFGDDVGSATTPIIEFTTPRAIRNMGQLSADDFKVRLGPPKEQNDEDEDNPVRSFSKYAKKRDGNTYLLRLYMKDLDKIPPDLKKNNTVQIKAPNSSSPLNHLNNDTKKIVEVKRIASLDGRVRVTIKIGENEYNQISPASQGSLLANFGVHTIQTTASKSITAEYTVEIGPRLTEGLIWTNNVRDVLVVTYRQWKGSLDTDEEEKRYYFRDKSLANSGLEAKKEVEKNAPSYSVAVGYFRSGGQQRNTLTRSISTRNGNKFAFYCTPVRYIKDKDGTWQRLRNRALLASDANVESEDAPGEGWLQINKAKQPRWGKADLSR